MRIIIKILLVCCFCFSFIVLAQEEKKPENPAPVKKDEKGKEKAAVEKTYTEKELKEAISKEIERTFKKIGNKNVASFSKELLQKEEDIKVRELELIKEKEEFQANVKKFEASLKEFEERQKKLLACMDDADTQKSNRAKHMVDVISGMKPEQAASVLSVQDPEITVQILGQLDAAKVSKIFNLMDKEISARLQKQYMSMKR